MVPVLDDSFILKLVLVLILKDFRILKLVLVPILNNYCIIQLVPGTSIKLLQHGSGSSRFLWVW